METQVALRPTFNSTPELFTELCEQVADKILIPWMRDHGGNDEDCERNSIIKDAEKMLRNNVYEDGYTLAKALENHCYWSPDSYLVSQLDDVMFMRSRILEKAVMGWVIDNDIKSTFAVGQRLDVLSKRDDDIHEGEIVNIVPETARFIIAVPSLESNHQFGKNTSGYVIEFERSSRQ